MEKKRKEGVSMVLKARVSGDVAAWMKEKRFYGEKSNVTSKALEFYHDYYFYRKGFIIRLIQENFEETKHLLRKIGRSRKNG